MNHQSLHRRAKRGTSKKLIEAARFWANAQNIPAGRDELADDLIAFGLEDEIPPPQESVFEIWPENIATFNVFIAVASQWRWLAGFDRAIRTGLDYSSLESTLNMMDVQNKAEIFNDIRAMEREALTVLNQVD